MSEPETEIVSTAELSGGTLLFLFVGIAAFANDFIVSSFWPSQMYGELAVSISIGILVAEVCLIGIWMGVANQEFAFRLTSSLLVFMGLSFGFLFAVSRSGAMMPLGVAWCGVLSAAVLLFATGFVVRQLSRGQVVARRLAGPCKANGSQRLSVKHFFMLTTIVAVATGVSVPLEPESVIENGIPVLGAIVFLLVGFPAAGIALSVFGIVFGDNQKRKGSAWSLAALAIFGPWLLVVLLSGGPSGFSVYGLGITYAYAISTAATTWLVLGFFHHNGYRLRTLEPVS